MNENLLLLVTIFLPLAGALLMWQVGRFGVRAARSFALLVTLATCGLAFVVVAGFPGGSGVYADTNWAWVGGQGESLLDIRFSVGLDGLGVWMFGLSALLMVTSVLVSWEAIRERTGLFYGMLLLLEFGCLGVFAARDIMLFYVFFEFTLIPLFFLIGIWGSEDRRYAAIKFFLFTLAGSVLTFLGLIAIVLWDYYHAGTGVLRFSISDLVASMQVHPIQPVSWQLLIFVALFAGFAIKVPLFPVHTWLPLAHVQAPTAGSVILAGILLKIGTYGFVRFSIPMLPDAAAIAMPWVLWMAVLGIVYGALVALAQTDIKRLIAYSSVSHLGFCMLGLFAFNPLGLQGGTLQMVNHGLSTGGLFAVVGMLYERYHTREISDLGGLAKRVPWLAFFMLLFTFSSIGLPGLNGFVGEVMVLIGMFQRAWTATPLALQTSLRVVSVLAVSGVVLGAWYMLWLVQRVFFGPLKEPNHHTGPAQDDEHVVQDMCWREFVALAPLAIFIVWIGLQPSLFLSRTEPTLTQVEAAVEKSLTSPVAGIDSTNREPQTLSQAPPTKEQPSRVR
ncbi:MAG: NADH-quinone oxidoreductase subunit M [Planctomycetaceae bacterium]|nr:NADH-quinone oxidoreductase subunit M [Planctomycetales bacterium]MCB9920847.1 NADH-quinone oxidoreductase subunit M [Planctomycetaceae bacterium]